MNSVEEKALDKLVRETMGSIDINSNACWRLRRTNEGWVAFYHPYGCEAEVVQPLNMDGVDRLLTEMSHQEDWGYEDSRHRHD